jgi:hypothetical protein
MHGDVVYRRIRRPMFCSTFGVEDQGHSAQLLREGEAMVH